MSHAGQSSSLIGTDGRRARAGDCPCWQVWSVVRARNDYDMRGIGLSGYEGLQDDMVAYRLTEEGGVGTCWGTLDTLGRMYEVTLAAALPTGTRRGLGACSTAPSRVTQRKIYFSKVVTTAYST